MFAKSKAFSGFAVDDLGAAKTFYGETLGLDVAEDPPGLLELRIAGGTSILAYPKPATRRRRSPSSTSRWTTSTRQSTS